MNTVIIVAVLAALVLYSLLLPLIAQLERAAPAPAECPVCEGQAVASDFCYRCEE